VSIFLNEFEEDAVVSVAVAGEEEKFPKLNNLECINQRLEYDHLVRSESYQNLKNENEALKRKRDLLNGGTDAPRSTAGGRA